VTLGLDDGHVYLSLAVLARDPIIPARPINSALRASGKPIAVARSGANGIRIKSRFDGKCVKTMVLMSPILAAIGTAIR
jgi:hypothetical protein